MDHYTDYFDQISQKLAGEGYIIGRDVASEGYHYNVVAVKSAVEASKFGVKDRFFTISTLDNVDVFRLTKYSSQSTRFALANRRSTLPLGFGAGLLSIPVLVSDDFSEELKAWVVKHHMKKHLAALEFPVLVSPKEKRIYYCKKTPIVGAAYYGGFRRFVEENLGFH